MLLARLRSRYFALSLIAALSSSSAWAQSGAASASASTNTSSANADANANTDADKQRAKAHYERGVQAYSAGRFKDAIDLFLQADALAPSAALSFNIARAYEKISDDAASLQWYRDFRRRASDAPNGPEVDRRIEQLEAVLAAKGVQQLTVLSTPSGATVTIDGQPRGVTPFTGQLAPGKHSVTLSLKGYTDAQQALELDAAHAQDLKLSLSPAPEAPPDKSPAGPADAATDRGPSGPRFGVWPYVVIGAGAASMAGALGFELARRSAEDAAKQDSTQIGYQDKLETMQSRQTTARILAAAGGALLLTGGTLLVLDLTSRPSSKPKAALGWACLPDGCAVDMRGSF
jgi:hypothetical protein